ncbi:MAG TPA: lysylphosphatidylglycerol synthase transmembrane domain-containing protein [Bacteroidales bacterium]|nr:lysylphosphatidylglycerol synthase transmembrane domain-containing protein [Bacteroidales bacterium]
MKSKYWNTIFKVLSSVLILWLLFSNISFDIEDFWAAWQSLRGWCLLLVLPVVLVVLAVKGFRWKMLLHSEGYEYSSRRAIRAYFAAYSVGVVTPGRLGELIKVYDARHHIPGIDGVAALRSVVLDRLFDMFFLSWFGLAGLFFYFKLIPSFSPMLLLVVTFVMLLLALFIGFLILKLITKKLKRDSKILSFLIKCMEQMLDSKNWYIWLFTALAYAIFFGGIELLFYSLNIHISFLESGFIISLIGLILLLPISIAGFGTREAGLIYLLAFYGISAETAISFSLLQFLTFFVWGGLIGLYFWYSSGIPLALVKEDFRKIRNRFSSKNGERNRKNKSQETNHK